MALELQLELCVRITVAALLSLLVGLEREWQGQPAGLRTHMLVGLGAALFTVLSLFAFAKGDPGRVAAQIVAGIGFLGAGSIIQRRERNTPHGLTTAAGIWAVAAIGLAGVSQRVRRSRERTALEESTVRLSVIKEFGARMLGATSCVHQSGQLLAG
jgi:uncharacterized membrane protein YhiD involved in acid resistance